MARKEPGSDPSSSHVSAQPDAQPQQAPYNGAAQPTQHLVTANGAGSAPSYPASNGHGGQTPYPPLAYQEQAASASIPAPPPFDASATSPLFYPAGTGQHAATPAGSEHVAQPNPLIEFASQATRQVAHQPAPGGMWRQPLGPGQNVWSQWTAAIADSPDRFSANALLTLGSTPRDPAAAVAEIEATSHTGQWPLLLFNETVPAGDP